MAQEKSTLARPIADIKNYGYYHVKHDGNEIKEEKNEHEQSITKSLSSNDGVR